MDNVNNLLEGSSPYQVLSEQSAKLAGKWEKSGLLEGIESSTERNNMSMLLENQAKQLVNEANTTGTGQSVTAGANSEAWAGVALPLVRRVFGEIVAKDLVSVQPMNLPAGLIFYLDFQYGEAHLGFAAGDSLYGATSDMKKTQLPTGQDHQQGLYGAGTYAYSTNDVSVTVNTTGSGASEYSSTFADVGGTGTFDLSAASASFGLLTVDDSGSVNYDEDFINSLTDLSLTLTAVEVLRVSTASLTDFDPEAVRSYTINGATNYNQFNSYTEGNGYVDLFCKDGTLANNSNIVVKYVKGPDNLDDRGDFEDGVAGTAASTSGGTNSKLDIPSIDVQLRSDTVSAKTRKLKAQWTPEFAQDLNAYHSIDAEAELTSILSEYISMEIDLEIFK